MRKFIYVSLVLIFFFITEFVSAQVTVTGKVTDAETKEPLIGASVVEKNTKNGTATDDNGQFTLKVKDGNAILVINYVGKTSQEIKVGNNNNFTIALAPDNSTLSDVVITGGRLPVRKMETTQAVEIIGNKTLKSIKPESVSEAVTLAPGIYANNSQGRRGTIVVRGFPDGNPLGGLVYTGILIDGLPSFGSPGRLTDAGFGFDANVEKVEVVRGSTATLFGRSAAAGVVNIISKTGGEKPSGSFKISLYDDIIPGENNFNYRMDWNVNGSVTQDKLVRYNIGGWFLNDNGFRKTGFKDKGYQIRGNFDIFEKNKKGKARLYFLIANYSFQNLTDVPVDPTTMKIVNGWSPINTFQWSGLNNLKYSVFGARSTAALPRPTVAVPDANGTQISRNVAEQLEEGNYGRNFQIGLNIERNLGMNWTLDNKFRYQALRSGTKYPFALPSYYLNNGGIITPTAPPTVPVGSIVGGASRLLLDGDADDGDLMNELRIKKSWSSEKATNNFQLGFYYSKTTLRPTTYSYFHYVNPADPNNLSFKPIILPAIFPPFAITVYNPNAAVQRGAITRRGVYTEEVKSIFIGHELKLKKLTVTLGARYDWLWIGMSETKAPFDSAINRNVSHKDYSVSAGFNYLFNKNTSLYLNVNRAFRMPDYTAYTSLEYVNATATDSRATTLLRLPNGLSGNEIIIATELGLRKSIQDFGIDVAVYYNTIKNRLASIFENGLLVTKPFGKNRIMGAEISLSYTPTKYLRGLSIRTSITLQKATFTEFKISNSRSGGIIGRGSTALDVDPNGNLYGQKIIDEGRDASNQPIYSFDVKGNKLPNVPEYIWNTTFIYSHKWFGLDFSANVNGKRFADATNVINIGTLSVLNAGGYFRIPFKNNSKQEIRIGAQVKNLMNAQSVQQIAGLTENSTALGQLQTTPNYTFNNTAIWSQGYIQLPRRWLFYVSFDF